MRRFLASVSILALLGAGCGTQNMGTPESGASWVTFGQFTGYETKYDPEKINDGAAAMGQNTTGNHGDRISVRPLGYGIFPSSADLDTTSTGIVVMHTFRLRGGDAILMRSNSSTLEWYDGTGTAWETLKSGYQSGDFGFADNNVNTDQSSYTYFGNGQDAFSRWNGMTSNLTATLAGGETAVTVGSTGGFTSTGSIVYCGTTQAYTSKTATTFTVASAVACTSGRGVAQAPQEFASETLYPRGNIYLFADNRLFISGTTSTQNVVYFSGYGTSTQFDFDSLVASSTAADPGLFNLAEGGGPVTAMVMDEGSIYFFKPSIIYKATLTDTVYSILPLKAFDGRSQTTGALGKRSVFTTANGVFFATPDNQILMLSRVDDINYPQTKAVSDPIKPTVEGLVFTSSTGVVYRDKAYFALRSTADSPTNDTVLVYDLDRGAWDTPIVGWSVADWAIYPDPVTHLDSLFWSDGTADNTYEVTGVPNDYIFDTAASWRTKAYDFGASYALKYVSNVFVSGYISPNTSLTVSLLCDNDGYTKKWSMTLAGTESTYIFNSALFNLFGLKPFGTTRFGSQEDLTGKKAFRMYLGKDFQQVACYTYQLEFASSGANQDWEVLDYGFAVYQAPVPERANLYRSFK